MLVWVIVTAASCLALCDSQAIVGEWSAWSDCDCDRPTEIGRGYKERVRNCTTPGGGNCDEDKDYADEYETFEGRPCFWNEGYECGTCIDETGTVRNEGESWTAVDGCNSCSCFKGSSECSRK